MLEVGSGGSPYYRSNVLADAYVTTRERSWAPLISDRPTVIAFGENLPFRDKSFDFVIASHVLEHSTNPALFLSELQRVAKAGYIEVPNALFERLNPYYDHRSEISLRNDCLIITKKANWCVDNTLRELYEHEAKPFFVRRLYEAMPHLFNVRYYWNEKIEYVITNPEIDSAWSAPADVHQHTRKYTWRYRINSRILGLIRLFASQRARNGSIVLVDLLRCPMCFSEDVFLSATSEFTCKHCGSHSEPTCGLPNLTIS